MGKNKGSKVPLGFHSDAMPQSFLRMPPKEIPENERGTWQGAAQSAQEIIDRAGDGLTHEDARLHGVLSDLEMAAHNYKFSGNTFELMMAFALYVRAGYYPCPDHLKLIASAFHAYVTQKGPEITKQKSLDSFLGLQASRGTNPAPKAFFKFERDKEILGMLSQLLSMGATRAQAVDLVIRRFQDSPNWNKSGWAIGFETNEPAAETIENMYDALPSNVREGRKVLMRFTSESVSDFGDRFLADFPLDCAREFLPEKRAAAVRKFPNPRPLEIGNLPGF